MSKRYRWGLVAAFVLQLALLGWVIADRATLLANGREVRFAVLPVDPRDLFLGDYVVLSYEFSRMHSGLVAADEVFQIFDNVYVALAESTDGWEATSMTLEPPPAGTFLRGTIMNSFEVESEASDQCPPVGTCVAYDIEYNLERFYVPEGTGREIEDLRNGERVSVDVALGDDGRAALKRLLVDDEVRLEENFY